jgi:hypothetical protein
MPMPVSSSLSADEIASLAAQAYVFGFPALELQRLRYNFAFAPEARLHTAFNTFRHIRVLATPNSREVTAPNNDTLYSTAWLDLSAGPVRLTTPPLGERYYSYAFMDFFTNVFEIVGRRNAPGGDGAYLIVGPDWQGEAPAGSRLIRSATNAVWLLARFLVDGADDIPAVHALQDRSVLDGPELAPDGRHEARQRLTVNGRTEPDAVRVFNALNSILTENPPLPADGPTMARLAAIGIGPGRVFRTDTPEIAAAVERGVAQARARIDHGAATLREGPADGRWSRPPDAVGDFGVDYDLRATIALYLIAALPPQEAMYLSTQSDSEGHPLRGEHAYAIRFSKDLLPPVNAFWSLTMYELDEAGRAWLVRNSLRRGSIGDRTAGLRYEPDGGLEIQIAREWADPSNCLPAPEGPFMLCMRVYEAKQALLDGSYALPPVERRA